MKTDQWSGFTAGVFSNASAEVFSLSQMLKKKKEEGEVKVGKSGPCKDELNSVVDELDLQNDLAEKVLARAPTADFSPHLHGEPRWFLGLDTKGLVAGEQAQAMGTMHRHQIELCGKSCQCTASAISFTFQYVI